MKNEMKKGNELHPLGVNLEIGLGKQKNNKHAFFN